MRRWLWLALAAGACGGAPETERLRQAVRADRSDGPPAAVAFRFAARRGADVRSYQLPRLTDTDWQFSTGTLVVARALGYGHDDDRAWALTPDRTLVALELETGRARVVDTAVVQAALGPRGAPIVATSHGAVRTWRGRTSRTLADSVRGTVERLIGTVDQRVLAVVRRDGGRVLLTLEPGGTTAEGRPVPDGPLAASPWGDMVAVASDTGLWVLERGREDRVHFLPADPADAVVFSAAGHRLYVARGGDLEVRDRYDLADVTRVRLPAPVLALRMDPLGRRMLGRHAHGDSVWVLPLTTGGAPVRLPGSWDSELPAVAPDGSVMTRTGDDVVAWDPDGTERGRLGDGAADRWVVAAWNPDRPQLELADATPQAQAGGGGPLGELFVQVSSTSNPSWAEDLARDLRQAGIQASVMAPTQTLEMYRVVVGPFATREEAEAMGRSLGMSFWIFQPEAPPLAQ